MCIFRNFKEFCFKQHALNLCLLEKILKCLFYWLNNFSVVRKKHPQNVLWILNTSSITLTGQLNVFIVYRHHCYKAINIIYWKFIKIPQSQGYTISFFLFTGWKGDNCFCWLEREMPKRVIFRKICMKLTVH